MRNRGNKGLMMMIALMGGRDYYYLLKLLNIFLFAIKILKCQDSSALLVISFLGGTVMAAYFGGKVWPWAVQ